MKGLLNTQLSKRCKRFVMAHWGRDGLQQVKERPVTWVRHEANPYIKVLRRKRKSLPLIAVHGEANHFRLELSTERKAVR